MPSWKRVIVSGSDAVLNSLNITTALTASGSAEITGSLQVIGNTTITGSLNMSGPISNVNFIDFNTAFSATQPTAGRLSWNNSDGTLDLGMKGGNVTQQIGQEIFYEIRNDTTSSILNGTSVYASGVTVGSGRITAAPFAADGNIREVRYLGLATEDISTGVNGFVTHFGYVRGLDTRGTAPSSIAVGDENWSVGDILYAHPTVPGKLTNIRPKHEIIVAIIIIRNQTSGVIFVRPSSFGHLDDIHDVNINTGSLSSGDLLVYDSGSDYWVNTKQLTGSYGLTGSLEATSFTGSLLGTASFATTASYAFNAITASFVTGSNVFGPFGSNSVISASFAVSASHIIGGVDPFPYTGSAKITGSLGVTGSISATAVQSNIFINKQTLTDPINIPSDSNALIMGPVGISGSVTVGIGSNLYITDFTNPTPNLQAVTDVGSTTTNSITAANFITTSDRRLKSDIKAIENPFEVLNSIKSYEYIKDGKKDAGFIAQEVQETIPYAVFENEEGMLTMSDRPLLAYLYAAVMELKEENKQLKKELKSIKP
jgi:hypothetical protein